MLISTQELMPLLEDAYLFQSLIGINVDFNSITQGSPNDCLVLFQSLIGINVDFNEFMANPQVQHSIASFNP